MKTHSKVVLAVAALCGAIFSEQTAQAVIVDLTTKTTGAVMTPEPGGNTKDIRLSEVATVGDYYSFVIDANEHNVGNAPLTLDALKGQSTGSIGMPRVNLMPTAAFTGTTSSGIVSPYGELGTNGSSNFDGSTTGRYNELAVARIIIVVPEVTSVLPLAGVLGLVLGARHLRRPRRPVRA